MKSAPKKACRIFLPKGYAVLVDLADMETVSLYRWSAHIAARGIYARTRTPEGWLPMHRLLMNPKQGEPVRHLDSNGLNNRRSNLRVGYPEQCSEIVTIRADRPSSKFTHHVACRGQRWRHQ